MTTIQLQVTVTVEQQDLLQYGNETLKFSDYIYDPNNPYFTQGAPGYDPNGPTQQSKIPTGWTKKPEYTIDNDQTGGYLEVWESPDASTAMH